MSEKGDSNCSSIESFYKKLPEAEGSAYELVGSQALDLAIHYGLHGDRVADHLVVQSLPTAHVPEAI